MGLATRTVTGMAVAVIMVGCGLLPTRPPQLVRDEAGMFSAEARLEAEQRLQQLARDRGVWLFVLTHPRPDPPRMLDQPMAEAADTDAVVVAVMLGPNGTAGSGSRDGEVVFEPPSSADSFIADGKFDDALDLIVRSFSAWATPASWGEEPGPPRPARPSGA